MDVFTWSLPFVGEKITDMLISILNTCTREELEEQEEEEEEEEDTPLEVITPPVDDAAERRREVKNKILAIGRMSKVFALMRSVPFLFLLDGETLMHRYTSGLKRGCGEVVGAQDAPDPDAGER